MTNFSPTEINRLWCDIGDLMATSWNVGRGKKGRHTGKDMLFMTLTALKSCGEWDVAARTFSEKSGIFEKMIMNYLNVLSPHLYELFVESHANRDTMKRLQLTGNVFKEHPCARYATDVTFQQSNMPSGTQKERSEFYSAKHKQHSFKVEVSVLPTGFALNCTKHYRGITSDIAIFRENIEFHQVQLHKLLDERDLPDEDPLVSEYPEDWAVLVDKGYQGLADVIRAIHPAKKQRGLTAASLSRAQEAANRRISSDRIIVENFFGRLCTLWSIASDKYRWAEKNYDTIFRACVGLTNIHIRTQPLRAEDGKLYRKYLSRLRGIGIQRAKMRAEIQKRSRDKLTLRLETTVMALPGESEGFLSQDY